MLLTEALTIPAEQHWRCPSWPTKIQQKYGCSIGHRTLENGDSRRRVPRQDMKLFLSASAGVPQQIQSGSLTPSFQPHAKWHLISLG